MTNIPGKNSRRAAHILLTYASNIPPLYPPETSVELLAFNCGTFEDQVWGSHHNPLHFVKYCDPKQRTQTTALFTTIKSWKRNNLGGNISVEIEYLLRSTKTGETLYKRGGKITVDTSVGNSSGSLLGFVVSKVATAINTAATDKVVAGRKCSFYVLGNMPQGKYGTMYDKDQKSFAGEDYIIRTVK